MKGIAAGQYHSNAGMPSHFEKMESNPAGRNRRSVWNLATQPLPFEHYAAFPEALVEPLILCGTSEWGCCSECGAPWVRVVEKIYHSRLQYKQTGETTLTEGRNRNVTRMGDGMNVETTGWKPTCAHEHTDPVPCVVLDPFAGSGTTLRVATRLGRKSIGIELNETYVSDILRQRTAQGGLGL
jgi:hypothetical protein